MASPEELVRLAIEADDRGDHDVAVALCRRAIAATPGYSEAWMTLGLALQAEGNLPGAESALLRAVESDPSSAPAQYNLGRARHASGEYREAIAPLEAAVRLRPRFIDAMILLASVREATGDKAGALTILRSALEIEPGHAGALINSAVVTRSLGDFDEAVELLQKARVAAPDSAGVPTALAATLPSIGRVEEARALSASAMTMFPDAHGLRSAYLFATLLSDKVTAAEVAAEHRRIGARYEAEVPMRSAPFRNSREPDRLLRVGFASGDFRRHPNSLFIEPLLENLDRRDMTCIAYSSVAAPDEMTLRIRGLFDEWSNVASFTDADLAARMENDRVDILLDLAGHSNSARLGVFARRPAPLQVTWLGYVNTTGLVRMDYRLCDAVSDPPGLAEQFSTEKLLRMPHSQWCFRPPPDAHIDPGLVPPEQQDFRFGSFNQFAKITETTVRLWAATLRAVPGSSLHVFAAPQGKAQQSLLRRFEEASVDSGRIHIAPRLPHRDYYRAFLAVDACLDTVPCTGGTTTCETLWMGIPVITLARDLPATRSSASILTAAGLPQYIAASENEYLKIAVDLANKGKATPKQRRDVRDRFQASPLMNEQAYARDLAAALRTIWKRWCLEPVGS